MLRQLLFFSALCLFMLIGTIPLFAAGNTVYLSTTGNDSNSGTQSAPVRTFAKALSLVEAGDTLLVEPGMYTERFVINKSGTAGSPITIKANGAVVIDGQNVRDRLIEVRDATQYITVQGFELKNSTGFGALFSGQHLVIDQLTIHHVQDHGLQVDGQHITVKNSTIYLSNLKNENRNSSSGWGSGFKCRVGGDDITFQNNTTYQNYGEGMAITRCSNVRVIGNRAYDNFSVNIYIDNSYDVIVEKNLITCTGDSRFNRPSDNARPSAITLGEEYYEGWGAQLARVVVKNNLAAYCSRGVHYFGADIPGGGLDNVTIANNTFWGSLNTAISMADEPAKTRNTRISNNIAYQPEDKVAVIENPSGITLSHNFWVRSTPPEAWRNANGTGDKYGDVKLVSTPSTDPTSFRLAADSPAIDAGVPLPLVTDDYEGKTRGVSVDMGAIEFAEVVMSPSPSPSPTSSASPSPSVSPSPAITPSPSPGNICRTKREDINLDGVVNLLDYAEFVNYFGSSNPSFRAELDVIEDSKINLLDVADVIANLMKSCP